MRSSFTSWRRIVPCAALLLGLVAFGCDDDDDDGTTTVGEPSTGIDGGTRDGGATGARDGGAAVADGGSATQRLSDAQIFGLASEVNTGEVLGGLLAAAKADDAAVQRYAERMIREHSLAQRREGRIADRLDIDPEDSPLTERVRAQVGTLLTQLQQLDGRTFDIAYMNVQVQVHATVLTLLDEQVIPQADADALERELRTLRRSVASHLTGARRILDDLTGAADGGVSDAGAADAGAGPGAADAGAGDAGEADAGTGATALTDEGVVAVTFEANSGEVHEGMLALSKAQDDDVENFAQLMVSRHAQAVIQQAASVLRPAGLGLEPNALSRQLHDNTENSLERLRDLDDEAFDLAYIRRQITAHTAVLSLIDSRLVPAVSDARLLANLRQLRAEVAAHLRLAQDVLRRLQGGEDAGAGDAGVEDASAGDAGGPTVTIR